MSTTTHVRALDRSVLMTNEWIEQVAGQADIDHETACGVARSNMRTSRVLRERISEGEVVGAPAPLGEDGVGMLEPDRS